MPAPPPLIAVVDDSAFVSKALQRLLRAAGFRVETHSSGAEFLSSIGSRVPDCVVLDLMMPIVSGWDVLQERVHDPELTKIPVIIVSANREPELVKALDKGICAFLPKPFDITALSALVKACVNRS